MTPRSADALPRPLPSGPPSPLPGPVDRNVRGIVLAIVLVLIFVLVTAVYAFQRRAIIDTSIARNRLHANEADALARGGLRVAEAVVFLIRLKQEAESTSTSQAEASAGPASGLDGAAATTHLDEIWSRMGEFPLELAEGRSLRISIEDEDARLNLNALVPRSVDADEGSDSLGQDTLGTDEEAEEYLREVLDYIVDGMEGTPEEKNYDTRAIALALLDYMDPDQDARSGRDEDAFYRSQDPPYRARNGPFLSFEEIGLVEGVDARLLEAMRPYLTVHPIGSTEGIHLNRAKPWVLSIVYAGTSGDRALLGEKTVRAIWKLREKSKMLCDDVTTDPLRCTALAEVGNGDLADGSFYPGVTLPAQARVFRVVAEARVGNLTRSLEAIFDTRSLKGPQLLSFRRLRGPQP